jgi:hypothetical protein
MFWVAEGSSKRLSNVMLFPGRIVRLGIGPDLKISVLDASVQVINPFSNQALALAHPFAVFVMTSVIPAGVPCRASVFPHARLICEILRSIGPGSHVCANVEDPNSEIHTLPAMRIRFFSVFWGVNFLKTDMMMCVSS